jgi:hypothetical protein
VSEYFPVLSAQRDTLEALGNQAVALVDKLPEYYKLMDGFERVDPNSSDSAHK